MDVSIKQTTTWKGSLKNLTLGDNNIVDEYGEIVNLMDILSQFYSNKTFDLVVSAKEEQIIDYEESME